MSDGLTVLGTTVGVLVAGVAASWLEVPPEYLVAVLVGPALLLGPRVAWGGVFGVVLADLGSGVVGPWTVLLAVWTAGVPYAAAVLRGDDGWRSPRAVGSYVVTLVVAVACTLAVVAWLAALLGRAPYLTNVWTYLVGAALSLPVGLAVLVAADYHLVDGTSASTHLSADGGSTGGRFATAALFVVGVGWLVAGTGLATLTHDVRVFTSRPAVVDYATGLAGDGTLGEIASGVLLALYWHGDLLVALLGIAGFLALAALWPPLRWARADRLPVAFSEGFSRE
ncbi:hypothetical protein [Halomarina litorea]|uniref:hypothetical protein n=1 Tax=Halomarina litorea TaxID=2961595 RepID=UPI0020C23C8E|nr:hypothetical protein [Halomarina sp. BCD28]